MIERIREFFSGTILATSSDDPVATMRRATAALLVEIMVTDGLVADVEVDKIQHLLLERFDITGEEAEELLALAKTEVKDATSLYPLTTLVNQNFSAEWKFELLCQLWQVAYADNFLDKYEEGLIRHVAELLHLPHSQFLKARNLARQRRTG